MATRVDFSKEAQDCRRKALAYAGKPEAPFLLRIAKEFDRLGSEDAHSELSRGASHTDRQR